METKGIDAKYIKPITPSYVDLIEALHGANEGWCKNPRSQELYTTATYQARLPKTSSKNLNYCPRIAHDRMRNRSIGTKIQRLCTIGNTTLATFGKVTIGKSTRQYSTVWGDRKHGYKTKRISEGERTFSQHCFQSPLITPKGMTQVKGKLA
jgi:hypothetical protein